MTFDRILTSVPIDKTAARQLSKGEHWEPDVKITQRHWDTPPKLRKKYKGSHSLIGVRSGRLTVVGYFGRKQSPNGKTKGAQSQLWLVKCDCGDFETRTGKALKKKKSGQDRCENCQYFERMKRREYFLANGINKQP